MGDSIMEFTKEELGDLLAGLSAVRQYAQNEFEETGWQHKSAQTDISKAITRYWKLADRLKDYRARA